MSQAENEGNVYQTPAVAYTDDAVYCDPEMTISQELCVRSGTEKLQESVKCLPVIAVAASIGSLLVAVLLGVIAMSTCSCDETVTSTGKSIITRDRIDFQLSVEGEQNSGNDSTDITFITLRIQNLERI